MIRIFHLRFPTSDAFHLNFKLNLNLPTQSQRAQMGRLLAQLVAVLGRHSMHENGIERWKRR
jgi:hypothetical protein